MRIIEEKLSASLQDMHISGQTKTNQEQIETPSYSQQTDDNEMDVSVNLNRVIICKCVLFYFISFFRLQQTKVQQLR